MPWVDAALLPALHEGVLGMLRRGGPTSLACPTMLGQSRVWGQQQCPGITEMTVKVVVSVQGEVNGDTQVELCPYPFSFILSCSLESTLSFAVGQPWAGMYRHGLVGAGHRASSAPVIS